jgi:hypothetical protein
MHVQMVCEGCKMWFLSPDGASEMCAECARAVRVPAEASNGGSGMTALERVEALKRDRRAELAAKAAAEEVERVEGEERDAANFAAALLAAFEMAGCPELAAAQSTSREFGTWNQFPIRALGFWWPGHLTVELRLVNKCLRPGEADWRRAGPFTDGEMATWHVPELDCDFETLADALIAAEHKPTVENDAA